MSPAIQAILALLAAAPSVVSQFATLWTQARSAFSSKDQQTVDAILAALDAKIDGDLAKLIADAAAAAKAKEAALGIPTGAH